MYCYESYVYFFISLCFFFNDPATTEIYTLSLHDALPISYFIRRCGRRRAKGERSRRKNPATGGGGRVLPGRSAPAAGRGGAAAGGRAGLGRARPQGADRAARRLRLFGRGRGGGVRRAARSRGPPRRRDRTG